MSQRVTVSLTLLLPGLLGAPQNWGRGWFTPPPPLHNFPISYAFALKIVTGVHQGLVNKLTQKNLMTSAVFYDVIFPQGPNQFIFIFYNT